MYHCPLEIYEPHSIILDFLVPAKKLKKAKLTLMIIFIWPNTPETF